MTTAVAARRLEQAAVGREQNEMARDSYSLLHFPVIAGVVLVALAMKKTFGDVSEPLKLVPAFALVGGLGVYLLAHVAFSLPQRAHGQQAAAAAGPDAVRAAAGGR